MDPPTEEPTNSEILDNIFDVSTLEVAIFWRETMLGRLQAAIDAASHPGVGHLRLCLLNNERMRWQPGGWGTTSFW